MVISGKRVGLDKVPNCRDTLNVYIIMYELLGRGLQHGG